MCQVYYGIVMEDEEPTVKVHPLSHKPSDCWRRLKAEGQTYEQISLPDPASPKKDDTVRFVCVSDTHGKHNEVSEVPDGDVFIHTGDFTFLGDQDHLSSFNDFLGQMKTKFKHVIVIAGNHDLPFDEASFHAWHWRRSIALLYNRRSLRTSGIDCKEITKQLNNCIYLQDSGVELFGYKIYGSPWQPSHWDLAFNLQRGNPLLEKWNMIPDDTDILLTHGPPLGHGDFTQHDLHVGCSELLSTVQKRVKPLYHVFGHIHEGYGVTSDGKTTFVNAATCTVDLTPSNPPVVFDLPKKDKD